MQIEFILEMYKEMGFIRFIAEGHFVVHSQFLNLLHGPGSCSSLFAGELMGMFVYLTSKINRIWWIFYHFASFLKGTLKVPSGVHADPTTF